MGITHLDRTEFLQDYWPGLYEKGQHVLLAGATQRSGKTYLGYQLLDAMPDGLAAKHAYVMKPRDKTAAQWSQQLGFKEVSDWPPVKPFWHSEPRGYTIWPHHNFDANDNERLAKVFGKAMMDSYKKGNTTIFLDEVYGICELGLQEELSTILSRGAGMGCGAWMCVQRGSGTLQTSIPGYVWSQPAHNFIAHSSNKNDRDKYAAMMGDFDPEYIHALVSNLKQYEFLYTNADGESAIISR